MNTTKEILLSLNYFKKNNIEKELKIAYQLSDMGAFWQIPNMDYYPDKSHTKWRKVRYEKSCPDLDEYPSDIQGDVLNRISQLNDKGEYQPRGHCQDQARTNFLYLATLPLEDDNPMRGKTVLEVASSTVRHSFNIITKLSIAAIKIMQYDAKKYESEKGLFSITFSQIKKHDPSAYIIDSWRIGYFNEPHKSLHYLPSKSKSLFGENKATQVAILAIGKVSDLNQKIKYYSFDKKKYITETIQQDKLKQPAWVKFRENVNSRVIPNGVFQKMLKEDYVITYNQILNNSVDISERKVSNDLNKITIQNLDVNSYLEANENIDNIVHPESKLSSTSSKSANLFISKDDVAKTSPEEFQTHQFLLHIAQGKQDEAEALLTATPAYTQSLIRKPRVFTDYSGRTFNCTAYEYAYWAKDTHMCRMLERYMDKETKVQILARVEEMERIDAITGKAVGLEYQQSGETHRSSHFDFTPLKQALKQYVDRQNQENTTTAWMVVGKAQRDLPAHVVQEYCRQDRSFEPTPQFNEEKLPRGLIFYNVNTSRDEPWFPQATYSGLGFNFAIKRNHARCAMGVSDKTACWPSRSEAKQDLVAITHLDEVRTAELTQMLKEEHVITYNQHLNNNENITKSLAESAQLTQLGDVSKKTRLLAIITDEQTESLPPTTVVQDRASLVKDEVETDKNTPSPRY